jgi:hypothetical protein
MDNHRSIGGSPQHSELEPPGESHLDLVDRFFASAPTNRDAIATDFVIGARFNRQDAKNTPSLVAPWRFTLWRGHKPEMSRVPNAIALLEPLGDLPTNSAQESTGEGPSEDLCSFYCC